MQHYMCSPSLAERVEESQRRLSVSVASRGHERSSSERPTLYRDTGVGGA